jgi:hypothetical protein
MRPGAMAHDGRIGMVPWQGQQTVQTRLRLGREGKALSRVMQCLFVSNVDAAMSG